MKQTQSSSPIAEESSSPVITAKPSRRRLIVGGMATPLLMSIASRPAWAGGGGMCTPSALASANVSGQHTFAGCGISAGWWKTHKNRWPIPHTTSFHAVFFKVMHGGQVLYQKPNGTSKTLGEVIDMSGANNNPGNLAMPLIGAYLNALSFPTAGGQPGYPYLPEQVVGGFNSLHNKPTSDFEAFKNTLDAANNLYDSITSKP